MILRRLREFRPLESDVAATALPPQMTRSVSSSTSRRRHSGVYLGTVLTPSPRPSGERILPTGISRFEPLNRDRSAGLRPGALVADRRFVPGRRPALRLPRKCFVKGWKSTKPLSSEVVAQRAGGFMGRVGVRGFELENNWPPHPGPLLPRGRRGRNQGQCHAPGIQLFPSFRLPATRCSAYPENSIFNREP
jgi:hypothetical protein